MSVCGCGAADCGGACLAAGPEPIAPRSRFAHAVLSGAMLDAIGGEHALDALSTRDRDDPAIALADAYAGALHVLGFAASRLSEDGTLATSDDRGALIELTRLIGYTPRPALASATLLAVTADTTPGAAAEVTVPAGTTVATLPRGTAPPVTFETDAALAVRGVWNALMPVRTLTVAPVTATAASLVVAGVDLRANPGDPLIVKRDAGGWLFARIAVIDRQPGTKPPSTTIQLTGNVVISGGNGPPAHAVVVLAQRAAAFGASAPDHQAAVPTSTGEWSNFTLPSNNDVDLEGVVKEAMVGRTVVFAAGTLRQVGTITRAAEAYRAGFNLSLPITRLGVNGVNTVNNHPAGFNDQVRNLAVYVETQRVALLEQPVDDETLPADANPTVLSLVGAAARDLAPGRLVVLQGQAPDGTPHLESATVDATAANGADTRVTLAAPVTARFTAASLVVTANVATATQGETIPNPPELLGSSSATRERPVYAFAATPVSHVPADAPGGYAPAAEVRVDGRLYPNAPFFLGLTDTRAWRLRPRRDGRFEVEFAGALPTSTNNVTARYRVGGGTTGNVASGSATMVMTPVTGVTGASNLTRGEGGSDAEGPEAMRRAGDTVTTLGRVVALADYERFARQFRGVGRAAAAELRIAMRREVVLTIGSSDPDAPLPSAALVDALGKALAAVIPSGRLPRIIGFVDREVAVDVAFAADAALDRVTVQAAIRGRLLAAFGRDARDFGRSLWASQIIAVVQDTPGVLAARVTLPRADPIAAQPARVDPATGAVVPAELVSLDPTALNFFDMPS